MRISARDCESHSRSWPVFSLPKNLHSLASGDVASKLQAVRLVRILAFAAAAWVTKKRPVN